MLVGDAPSEARREAASLLVTVLPPRQETLNALRTAAGKADDEGVRDWAAVAMMRLGASDAQDRLHTLLAKPSTQTTEGLCIHAALALAEQSDKAGLSVLGAALDACGSDITLCRRILSALGSLKDARAVQPLVAHLAFVQTRRETALALAAIADPTSTPALIVCLESDAYVPVRTAAAEALGRLGGARAISALRSALGHEREETVRAAIQAALLTHGRQK
jgi:HEAT repeat protein